MLLTERCYNPKDILIKWIDIKCVYTNPRTQIEIFLDMEDGTKISMTTPHTPNFFISHHFTDEFIDFIEKHMHSQDSLVE